MEKYEAKEKAIICSKRPEFKHPGRYLTHKERHQRLPFFGSSQRALYIVFLHNDLIIKGAHKAEVSHSIIQAIVFREVLIFRLKDIFAFHSKNKHRGICRVTPEQAIKADKHFGIKRDRLEVCKRLWTTEGNISYVAKIVKRKADQYGIDARNMTDEEIAKVLTAITGSERYGTSIRVFTRAFQKTGT